MRVESQDPKSWCLINGQNCANTARATTMRYISIFLSINSSIIVSRNMQPEERSLGAILVHIIAETVIVGIGFILILN